MSCVLVSTWKIFQCGDESYFKAIWVFVLVSMGKFVGYFFLDTYGFLIKVLKMDRIHPILHCNCPRFYHIYNLTLDTNLLPNNYNYSMTNNIFICVLKGLDQPLQIKPIFYLDLKCIHPKIDSLKYHALNS